MVAFEWETIQKNENEKNGMKYLAWREAHENIGKRVYMRENLFGAK